MVHSSVEQVMIEKLGETLGVSRGSFYWHFKSRDELLTSILDQWTQTATIAVQEHLDRGEPDAARRLLLYMRLPLKSSRSLEAADLELAILGWARRSEVARGAMARVDEIRINHLSELLIQMGLSSQDAKHSAHLCYAFLRYVAQRRDMAVDARLMLIDRLYKSVLEDIRRIQK